jgi:hypothetical protein
VPFAPRANVSPSLPPPIAQSLFIQRGEDKTISRVSSAAPLLRICRFASRSWLLEIPTSRCRRHYMIDVCSPASTRGPPPALIAFEKTLRSGLPPKSHHPSVILVRHEDGPLLSLFSSNHICSCGRQTRQLHVPELDPSTDLDRGFGFPT